MKHIWNLRRTDFSADGGEGIGFQIIDGTLTAGRDAMANYILVGSMQLGTELFTVSDGKLSAVNHFRNSTHP